MSKGHSTLPVTPIITIDTSMTSLLVFQCFYRTSTKQPTSQQTTVVHMVSEQNVYEGNDQRRGEEVAMDQSEVYDNEEKCKAQA